MTHFTAEVFKKVNRKYRPRKTMVQLSTPTPTPSATLHSVTDRRTDDSMMPIADHTV